MPVEPYRELALTPYRIQVPLNDEETILYSTLTTSLVVMGNDELDQLIAGDFDSLESRDELIEMGFLYDRSEPQDVMLRDLRQKVIDADTGIVGVTIAPPRWRATRATTTASSTVPDGALWTTSPQTPSQGSS